MTPGLIAVTLLTLIATTVYLWRGWRALTRIQRDFDAHVDQAIEVTRDE